MLQNPGASLRYRTIWLSDIHLGYRHCKADFLLEFLATVRCDTIFLVGDVLDLWSLRNQWHWPAAHSAVLRALLERADDGTRAAYVPGNPDEPIRDLAGNAFATIADGVATEHSAGELGDLLFAIVNVARHLRIDPELALRAATDKFRTRFEGVERLATQRSIDLRAAELATLDALWDEVKAAE